MATPQARFLQTITFKAVISSDGWGKPTLGSSSTAPARVQPTSKRVKNDRGDDVQASHVVYTAAALTGQHRVWFPGENTADDNVGRRPVAVDVFVDGAGVESYRKVWF
jgi:hypothetical protein